MNHPTKLGELLIERGEISSSQLEAALAKHRGSGKRLGEVLVESGFVSRKQLAQGLRLQRKLILGAFGAAMAMGSATAGAAGKLDRKPVEVAALSTPHSQLHATGREYPKLRQTADQRMQAELERTIREMGLSSAVKRKEINLALVDITDPRNPAMAQVNGDNMMYAVSLPKIGILLGAFARIQEGSMQLTEQTRRDLTRMIRNSSNTAATAMYNAVGPDYLAKVLQSAKYRLYDPEHNGGLWVGKPYAKSAAWKRDPLHNISHGATALQVARFLYLMETGQLVSPELSQEMKQIMGDPAIHHKFVKGLEQNRPGSKVFRKSGSWRSYHADCAVVERDGHKYIAVALANNPRGGDWLSQLIVKMDDIVFSRDPGSIQLAAAR